MNAKDISKLAFLLYPIIVKSQPDDVSIEALAARIKALRKGLMPEDEFAATVCWLGNCAGIHRIDQSPTPFPKSGAAMRAPDFIAFPLVGDKPTPILIEVKSHSEKYLDWTEKYLNSLKAFAQHLNLPLLVAWKCRDLWTLVDHQHFEKNITAYRLTLETALREDLSCVLFQNLRIQMNPEMAVVLDMEILDTVVGGTDTLLPAGSFPMRVAKARLQCGGVELRNRENRHFMLLLTAPDEEEIHRTGAQTCQIRFRPIPNCSFTLSNVLITQLSLASGGSPDWHQLLSSGSFPSSGADFRHSLRAAIDKGFVRYVLDVLPNTWPTCHREINCRWTEAIGKPQRMGSRTLLPCLRERAYPGRETES